MIKTKEQNLEKPIIPSRLFQDKYKYSMGNFVYQRFPNFTVEYKFKCRNRKECGFEWTEKHVYYIKKQLEFYCNLIYTEQELKYLSREFPQNYIIFLRNHKQNKDHVFVELLENGDLDIRIKGLWCEDIYLEVPLLAITKVVTHKLRPEEEQIEIEVEAYKRLEQKYNDLKNGKYNFKFIEFGTRRIFNINFQWEMIKKMQDIPGFIGTSNVYYAQQLGQKALGTQAHELFMGGQVLQIPLYMSQKWILQMWRDMYKYSNPDFMSALTDIIGIDYFNLDFNKKLATDYIGSRHDSGCPFEWGDKTIGHYENLGINPKTKTGLWSDKNDFNLGQQITDKFQDYINSIICYGTFMVHDSILPAEQSIIKPVKINELDVAKISDSPGKNMCENNEYEQYLMWSFKNRR
jgi:nicotinate phosphoribosyltransferase